MSAKKLKGVDLGDAIMRELNAYSEGLATEADNAAKRNAKKLQKKLMNTSPEDTGKYSKGWRVKEIPNKSAPNQPSRYVVHNKTDYRLTHLLEYGHAKKGGTERVKAQPHIEPARDEIEKEFTEEMEEAVKKVGR
ncbi:MAG: HK97 gp10 family phage protein [Clostridia bacterium]|nr:HK97 gp10 family phage protein [Clostridia bacterium]